MTKPFAGLALAIDKPGRCYLTHPVTRQPLMVALAVVEGQEPASEPAYIDILSWHSRPAQEHRYKLEDRLRRTGAPLSAEEGYNDMGEMLARMTAGWQLADLHGSPIEIPAGYEMAAELYNGLETRWLRNQVLEFVNNEGNFPAAGLLN